MKRIFSLLLIFALALSTATTALATDDIEGGGQPQETEQQTTITVATLEELQAAVDAAENGDIIEISESIHIVNAVLATDKSITLTRSDNFDNVLLYLTGNSGIEGFSFEETEDATTTIEIFDSENSFINNCTFKGTIKHCYSFVELYCVYAEKTTASIENCSFYGNGKGAMSIKRKVEAEINDCTFSNNSTWLQGGAIYNDGGSVIIDNCIVANNIAVSGGGIFNSGDLTITNSKICSNTITNPKFGSDILSVGTLSIDNYTLEDMVLYDESTGEQLLLPLVGHVGTAKLIYLAQEQATEYFAPEPPKEEEPPPLEPGDDSDSEDAPPEQPESPQEPGDQTGDDGTPAEEQPPQMPTQPPESDIIDDPIDTPITTPDTPQQPTDSGSSEDDDYTPPVSHRPAHKPSTPIKPTPTPEPVDKPKLSCGGAAIDTSKKVVLLGYGDGDPHENDPLTRAQLATIIYRLLDDESIALYSNTDLAFTDVTADAWYAPFVQTINCAGIVYGVGDGHYAPEGLVSWAQIVTVLSRFVEPQEYELQYISYNGWAQEAVQTAVALGWIEDSADFSPDTMISRGELVQLVNGVLAMYR